MATAMAVSSPLLPSGLGLRLLPPPVMGLAPCARRPSTFLTSLHNPGFCLHHPRLGSPASAYTSSYSSTSLSSLQSSAHKTLNLPESEASELEVESSSDSMCNRTPTGSFIPEHRAIAALFLALGFALGSAEAAMALGPEGPLVEEFWDNMRRYGLYFLTVATGGMYSLVQPIFALLRNPITAILTLVVISGSFYLLYLTLNTMLGVIAFDYKYA